ncbi:hypothetical protein [Cellulomonas chengniuliangii]|uniref:Uncharacterized protein n=1 Tax=Cellulomonas chengniuliangii TaxID=2968084 RepID=A0ABY5L5R1_9CELL|nr:hypothetical protein [Cellulomonas chengniuliangii]MCC2308418.1 hypothetical protein [Cellulomonas chengniuliangii]MCC2317435.1 hypothetical protein [Cellulomonas chengniuliangii]UUI76795.1 hypothetical protein NP064_07960 [Cellulomonas chengniuliangii]
MHPVLVLLTVVLMLAVSAAGGWVLTGAVLHLAGRSSDAGSPGADTPEPHAVAEGAGPRSTALSDGPDGDRARAVLRGGTWIGILERVAVTGCLLVGESSGIAIVVAVKGLGRYPELRENPGASERFVIGTLTSMIWAALIGIAGRSLLLG